MIRLNTLALISGLLLTSALHAAILDPGKALEIHFSVSNAVPADDTLWLGITGGTVNVLSPYTAAIANIYDGSTFLGTSVMANNPLCGAVGPCSWGMVGAFGSSSSTALFGLSAPIPFAAISNGTIDGRIELTIRTGAVDVEALPYMILGASQADGSLIGSYEQVNILSATLVPISTATPEPGTFMIFAPGLAFVAALRKRIKLARWKYPTRPR